VFDPEADLGELAMLEVELAEVAIALRRLDDGSYGTCEVCGFALGEADPLARRCGEHPLGP
jgi:RNA polymerase-binding transcription factor DksA